jgi:hypothetical protein
MGKRNTIAFLVALALTTTGCDVINKLKKAKEDLASTTSSAAAKEGPLSDDPDEALGLKLNHPIECINNTSSAVFRSYDRYVSWIDPKTGITGKERNVYGLYEINKSFIDRCKKALVELKNVKEPKTPELDGLAATYEAKLDAVVTAANDAFKYYNQKDYEDDKFAKAKTMHPGLIKAFEEFEAADKAMRQELTKLKSGMNERELAKVEKEQGKKLLWHKLKMSIVAEKVADAGNMDISKIDLAKLEAATKDLEDLTNQLESYAKAHPEESSKVLLWSTYEAKPGELLRSAKAVMRRVRDKKPFETSEMMMINAGNPQMIEGHPAHLTAKYNDLIKASNSLKF